MIPFVFLLSCSDSPVVDDSERQDSDPPPASCSEELEGQASLCIQIDGSETTPMKPHFSGFNVQNFRDGWQPWDERLVEASLAVIPGTVRFPGGASSYVYHWKTGSTPAAYVDAFTLKDRSKVRFDDYRSNSAGKGYVKLHDYVRFAQATGANLILGVNAMTDTPESVGEWAEVVVSRGYDVFLWELAGEPHNWADENWCDDGPCTPFWEGGDGYAEAMRLYEEAIRSAYVEAGLEAPPIIVSTSDAGDTERQRTFDGVDLIDGVYEGSTQGGLAWYGSEHDPDASHEKYWVGWVHHWYPGKTAYQVDDLSVGKTDPDFWPLFKRDLNHEITQRATGHIADYYLPISGRPNFGDPVPDDMLGYITEYNLRFTVPYTSSMFSAIHAAESVLRWSGTERIAHVGYHALTATCIGAQDDNRYPPIVAFNRNYVVDTQDLEYGLFDELPCLALRLVNRSVNTSDYRVSTTLFGGVQVAASEVIQDVELFGDWKWHLSEDEHWVESVYAQAYAGRDGVTRLLITNRSESPHSLRLIQDEVELGPDDILAAWVVSTETELFANDGDVEGWNETHPDDTGTAGDDTNAPEAETPVEDVGLTELSFADGMIPAWSVVLIELPRVYAEQAPAAPEPPTVSAGPETLSLAWPAVDGAESYRVSWGVQPGIYTWSELVTEPSLVLSGRMAGIPHRFVVSALDGALEGPPSAEVGAEALPLFLVEEDFDSLDSAWGAECSLGSGWAPECIAEDGWTTEDGALVWTSTSGPGSEAVWASQEANTLDQRVRVEIRIDSWTELDQNPRIGVVGRCSDSAHCVLGYLDPNAGIARIIVKNPELPGGWLVVGRSDELIELPVLSEQVELNAEDEEVLGPLETTMELELDGQTLRLWLGSGEQRRLIATGLDAFVLDESSGDLENVSARLGQPLTSAGPAGVYARRQPAHFDDFELLPY